MNELAIVFDTTSKKHLYEQIYEYVVNEIKSGKLLCKEKLPSTRFLAEYLQISRSTVELAYEQLLSEGYIESQPYRGYYVAQIEELFSLEPHIALKAKVKKKAKEQYAYDFSPNGIEASDFPFSVWKKVQKEALLDNANGLFESGDPMGEWELRTTIARYLHASRGVECETEQIIIGAGNDYLLMLLGKIMGKSHSVAMEEYTHKRAFLVLKGCGYEVEAVAMDEAGIRVELLRKTKADMVYTMPAHQFPCGIVMPIGRRAELLAWANEESGRYIIEDDYDSEFRYKGKPIPALQASDKSGRVIYIGTFSKSIAPAIRISYMVLPIELLKKYRENAGFYASTVSRIEQMALRSFMENGYFERHLNKMRKVYKAKHDIILQEIKTYLTMFEISGENAGLHILLTYQGTKSEKQLMEEAKGVGIKIYAASDYCIVNQNEAAKTTILLGFAGLSEEQMKKGIQELKKVWMNG